MILLPGEGSGWETADGGETWVRVGSGPSGDLHCTAAGCALLSIIEDEGPGKWIAQRVGRDLPNVGGGERVAGSTRPAAPDPAAPAP
ncbi:MAG TPA: hypothetical protein VNO21_19120 [Polyangiaceae bacterium]|nr:hypothetical protein [Polyangiaceae bacterium]